MNEEIEIEIETELLEKVEYIAQTQGFTAEAYISKLIEAYVLKKFPEIV